MQCSYYLYCLCYDLYTSSGEYSEEVLKLLENSKNLRDFTLNLGQLPSHYMASIVCGCFQSRTLEKLEIEVKEVRVYYKLCHRENVCCARARLHVEPLPVDTYRTRFTRVPVRCMYGPVCYRIGILYHGMPRKHGRRSTRK